MGKVFRTIKKGIKSISKFVKKNWKAIVITAAVVFTAGIATVGFAGMSSAFGALTAAGTSPFMAGLQVAGSTLWAGATSIAGTLGIGPGASGMVAEAAGMEGTNLFTGALAAKLGGTAAQANVANAAAPVGDVMPGGSGFGTIGKSQIPLVGGSSPPITPPPITPPPVTPPNSFMNSLGGAALIQGGIGAIQGYYKGKQLEGRLPLSSYGFNSDGSAPSFVLPGRINPDTGQPFTEEEAREYNELQLSGVPA